MDNKKLAGKITQAILRMDSPGSRQGDRLAIMFRGKNGKETSPGGRNKECLISVIEEILDKTKKDK